METIILDGVEVPIGSHEGKTVVIGSDHRGYEYKKNIVEKLRLEGFQVIDVGTHSNERCDYPKISNTIGEEVSKDIHNRVGIGICGSGIGILIPASKHKRVYTARCLSTKESETSRRHNNTNVLGIGADEVDINKAFEIINAWLKTPFYADKEKDNPYLLRYVQTVKLEKDLKKKN